MKNHRLKFIATFTILAPLLFLTLHPIRHGIRGVLLPTEFHRWINENDELSNFIGFGALSFLGFLFLGRGSFAQGWSWRLAFCFALIVVAIELVQFFIPGRICDIKDISAGWGGIMTASGFQLVATIPTTRNRSA